MFAVCVACTNKKKKQIYIYIYTHRPVCCLFSVQMVEPPFPGAQAAEQFPEHGPAIQDVRQSGLFGPQDLCWIAGSLQFAIRGSMAHDTLTRLQECSPTLDIKQDAIYGAGAIRAHLYFSFTQAIEGNRLFGHWDILVPCDSPYVLAKYFAHPVPWTAWRTKLTKYIYIKARAHILNILYINRKVYMSIFAVHICKYADQDDAPKAGAPPPDAVLQAISLLETIFEGVPSE